MLTNQQSLKPGKSSDLRGFSLKINFAMFFLTLLLYILTVLCFFSDLGADCILATPHWVSSLIGLDCVITSRTWTGPDWDQSFIPCTDCMIASGTWTGPEWDQSLDQIIRCDEVSGLLPSGTETVLSGRDTTLVFVGRFLIALLSNNTNLEFGVQG